MSGKILISCKDATNFISKKEEKKLNLLQRLQLTIHLIICEFCKLFYKQNNFLINNIKNLSTEESLTESEIKEIESKIDS